MLLLFTSNLLKLRHSFIMPRKSSKLVSCTHLYDFLLVSSMRYKRKGFDQMWLSSGCLVFIENYLRLRTQWKICNLHQFYFFISYQQPWTGEHAFKTFCFGNNNNYDKLYNNNKMQKLQFSIIADIYLTLEKIIRLLVLVHCSYSSIS